MFVSIGSHLDRNFITFYILPPICLLCGIPTIEFFNKTKLVHSIYVIFFHVMTTTTLIYKSFPSKYGASNIKSFFNALTSMCMSICRCIYLFFLSYPNLLFLASHYISIKPQFLYFLYDTFSNIYYYDSFIDILYRYAILALIGGSTGVIYICIIYRIQYIYVFVFLLFELEIIEYVKIHMMRDITDEVCAGVLLTFKQPR
eukprot:gene7713-5412_t